MSSPLGLTNKDFSHSYGSSTAPYNSVISAGKFYYRPPSGGNANKLASSSSKVHRPGDNDDVYDVSTNSIINYTQKDGHEAMRLRATDFVYLRDLGVYPNNRLIVARRFPVPVGNDLTAVNQKPLSTIIGWVSDDKDFGIKGLTFNEEWTDGEGSLSKILKDMFGSKEVGGGVAGVVGSIAGAAKNAVPLPGATRALQYKLLEEMGIRTAGQSIPDGNPNFIQQSKMRKTIDTDENASALTSKFEVELKTTYEQKMINNVDPTLVFLDVIGNILRFGTSKSEFFLNGQGGDTFKKFFKKFQQGKWIEAISIIIKVVKNAIGSVIKEIGSLLDGGDDESGDKLSISDTVSNLTETLGEGIIAKYKVKIASVISAWTGAASAPWHVTIGNPKQPFFSSGDMVCESVTLSFGTVLSFNDLPSTIEVTTKLTPARNLGLQEIFERFNTGAGRSYLALSDSFESNDAGTYWNTNKEYEKQNELNAKKATDATNSDLTESQKEKLEASGWSTWQQYKSNDWKYKK